MRLHQLLEGLTVQRRGGSLTAEIKGIAYDSRLVEKDFLFVAVRGYITDGHLFIGDAIRRGATAIIAEETGEQTRAGKLAIHHAITCVQVPDSRHALALVSSRFYGEPAKELTLIGITGTNGKTTTGFLTRSILEAAGRTAGLLGTIWYMTGDRITAAANTTPESLDLQRYLHAMVGAGMEYAVLEVSSHALVLRRIDGCVLRVAVFTNFTQDHLDFHGSMDEYFLAKRKIFDYLETDGIAVLNWDDQRVRSLVKEIPGRVITCGLTEGAMIRALDVSPSVRRAEDTSWRSSFVVETPEKRFAVTSRFIGHFNITNILLAVGIGMALGLDEEAIARGIEEARPVPGRFEQVDEGQHFLAVVDYAHTEDALRNLIREARLLTKGRVLTVFGCGGDRDRSKRPRMGEVASTLSDFVFITSDNPRTEDPDRIITDILQGIRTGNFAVHADRAEAIRVAVKMAAEGDTLILAGKGHEDYQEMGGVKYPFSDREVLRAELRRKTGQEP